MKQQDFWKGEFGDTYIERNKSKELIASNLFLFAEILKKSGILPVSILELGANIGLNLDALHELLPECETTGVEINKKAAQILNESRHQLIQGDIEEVVTPKTYDLVFTKGVLMHLNPESLQAVYKKMFNASNRWILLIEYYSRSPQEIPYRGHQGMLFKRDFAGELLEEFRNSLELKKYGFIYHRDLFPQDDLTWFLMEKK
jgi:spore coat polysaccharide biosynthesis protein SpsF